jgi:two-component system osmolarity sensor histidine kinase EnvZ
MKTPVWFPQSFFSRTLWLVLIVVLFSKALTLVYLLMNEEPMRVIGRPSPTLPG